MKDNEWEAMINNPPTKPADIKRRMKPIIQVLRQTKADDTIVKGIEVAACKPVEKRGLFDGTIRQREQ